MPAPVPDWDPVMVDVFLIDHEEPDPNETLTLEVRRSALNVDMTQSDAAQRRSFY